MFTSTALSLQETGAYMIYFAAGVTLFHLLLLPVKKLRKWDESKLIMLDTIFIGTAMSLIIIDRLLKEYTYYTLTLGIERFFQKLISIFNSQTTLSDFFKLFKKNSTAVLLFIIGIICLLFLFWFIKRLNWEKVGQFIENRSGAIRKTALVLIACLLILTAGIFIEGKINPPDGPNIVLIVVDCLRPDHMGYYGYSRDTSPVMDRLAREGLVFKNTYSNAPWTKPAVVSLFTSLYPNTHGVIGLLDCLPVPSLTMAEILKNNGYDTFCLIGGNSALRKEFNFQQGFDFFMNGKYSQLSADVVTGTFLSLIPESQKKRFFAYIHYMDAHLPYNKNKYNRQFPRKAGALFAEPGKIDQHDVRDWTASNKLSDDDKNYLVSLYDGQIRFVDEHIGKIIAVLKEKNILENTLVIITADHGEEFWEHKNVLHAHTLYNELIHVPLIMTGNRLTHSEINNRVTLIDLLPTILESAAVPAGKYKLQGIDLLDAVNGKNSQWGVPIFATGALFGDEKFCIIDKDNWKLILNTKDVKNKGKLVGYRNEAAFELYNLTKDPLEQQNLKDTETGKLARLKKEIDNLADLKKLFKSKKRALDEKTKDRLRSLGYL
jgi:arylsulfatase A-like enzyme